MRLLKLGLLALAATAVAAIVLWQYAFAPMEISEEQRSLSVGRGASLTAVAQDLKGRGILPDTTRFVLLGRLSGHATGIKAGTYELPERITPLRLLEKLTRGEFAQASITFIEGWTFAQFRQALNAHPGVTHHTRDLSNAELLTRIGASQTHPEGLFFPDTYLFAKGASDVQVLQAAYRAMNKALASAWAARSQGLPLRTSYEALILASIVEKETGRPQDRTMIAAVFVNRLRRNMLLQTDPTVIYGLGERFDGNLRRVHLETDGPYNTYRRAGLPPTPIAAPGRQAIEAAVHPAHSDALYFVARGDGSSAFSGSLGEHNNAVRRYQLNQ